MKASRSSVGGSMNDVLTGVDARSRVPGGGWDSVGRCDDEDDARLDLTRHCHLNAEAASVTVTVYFPFCGLWWSDSRGGKPETTRHRRFVFEGVLVSSRNENRLC